MRCAGIHSPGVERENEGAATEADRVDTLLSTDVSRGVAPHSLRGVTGAAGLQGETRTTTALVGVGRELGVAGGVKRDGGIDDVSSAWLLLLLLLDDPGVFKSVVLPATTSPSAPFGDEFDE